MKIVGRLICLLKRRHKWGEDERKFVIIYTPRTLDEKSRKLYISPDFMIAATVASFVSSLRVTVETHDGNLGFWAVTKTCQRCGKIQWIKGAEDILKRYKQAISSGEI